MEEKTKQYKTAIYLRLSKGDEDVDGVEKAESNSISNQRLIIGRYLDNHPEFQLVDTYIDDGYTGTNFKRPELKRMLYDVDEGNVDCIIVKDLSRFGRERIETGNYISKIFKDKGVRFIAINDNYDSLTADGSETHLVMPIKALTNDNFSRDISMKVRSSQSVKRERGEFIGAFPPYGYKKDPENKNHLIPDEYAGRIVQDVFAKRINGMNANTIANYLKESGVLIPSKYKQKMGMNYIGNFQAKTDVGWTAKQVIRILENEVYLGSVVQGRATKVSYKVAKLIEKPKEEWSIVPNMHEPLISKSDFDIVRSLLARDSMAARGGKEGYLFSGLVFCGDCGKTMVRKVRKNKTKTTVHYVCSKYNKTGKCPSHNILEVDLKEIVLQSLNGIIKKLCHYSELASNLENIQINMDDAIAHDKEITALKDELKRYSRLKSSLYQDAKEGILNEDQFERYREQYTQQEVRLQIAVQKQQEIIQGIYKNGIAADAVLQQFKINPEVTELNRILLVTFVDKILIYEDDVIEIVYRHREEMKKLDGIIETAKEQEAK